MKLSSTVRSIISMVFGLILLVGFIFLAKSIAGGKKKPEQVFNKVVQSVYVDTVKNSDIAIQIDATGNIQAQKKIELYAEVQGIFKSSSNLFKPGQKYNAGSTLLSIDDSEYKASLIAARSGLYNQITAMMPDLNLDYPNIAQKWKAYLSSFDINNSAPSLPGFENDQEKYFVSGKGIVNSYYNVKNMEERLSKYRIAAPFSGILTEALVTEGALIRSGQKLGEFIDPSKYELELAVNESYKDLLKIGNKVKLNNVDGSKNYTGTVKRVNSIIDASTQSIQAFVEVSGKDLNEGMYLEAQLEGKLESNVFEISRKLLLDNKNVYAVKDSTLFLQAVKPIYFTEQTAIVKGIPDGTIILSKSTPSAHSGMVVKIISNSTK